MRKAVNALLGVVVGGAGAYAGGVCYALENQEFREVFTKRIYGAEWATTQAQRWRDEEAFEKLKNDMVTLREHVSRIASESYKTAAVAASTVSSKAQELYETSKSRSGDAGAKTKELVEKGKATSENISKTAQSLYNKSAEAAHNVKAKSQEWYDKASAKSTKHDADEVVALREKSRSAGQINEERATAVEKTNGGTPAIIHVVEAAKDKAAQAAQTTTEYIGYALGTPEVAALASSSTPSADPVIGQLGRTLRELDDILGQLPSEQARKDAQRFMVAAAKEVKDLSDRVEKLKADHHAARQKSLEEQSKKLEQVVNDAESRMKEELRKAEKHLRDDFSLEKAELSSAHRDELKLQLSAQAAKFDGKLRDELASQALALERRWLREVRLHVDRERGGRLARLDQLESRLLALERLTDRNALAVDESVRAHRLRAAVEALRNSLFEHTRRPFARELAAVRAVAGVTEGDPHAGDSLINAASASIPTSTAEVGIDTLADLVARFTVVADEVRKVALVPEDAAGVVPHAVSAILSHLMFRKHGLPAGSDVESILARAEFYLHEEELDMAARELNQLKGWAKAVASDWLKAARTHLEVKQAFELIELRSNSQSLQMC